MVNSNIIVFLTAHSPDNSFLGFAVPRRSEDNRTRLHRPNMREAALVYGKDPFFWKVSTTRNNIHIENDFYVLKLKP